MAGAPAGLPRGGKDGRRPPRLAEDGGPSTTVWQPKCPSPRNKNETNRQTVLLDPGRLFLLSCADNIRILSIGTASTSHASFSCGLRTPDTLRPTSQRGEQEQGGGRGEGAKAKAKPKHPHQHPLPPRP
eukprot:scaffold289862_cov15-Tisochrysis_lutea.AAC.1